MTDTPTPLSAGALALLREACERGHVDTTNGRAADGRAADELAIRAFANVYEMSTEDGSDSYWRVGPTPAGRSYLATLDAAEAPAGDGERRWLVWCQRPGGFLHEDLDSRRNVDTARRLTWSDAKAAWASIGDGARILLAPEFSHLVSHPPAAAPAPKPDEDRADNLSCEAWQLMNRAYSRSAETRDTDAACELARRGFAGIYPMSDDADSVVAVHLTEAGRAYCDLRRSNEAQSKAAAEGVSVGDPLADIHVDPMADETYEQRMRRAEGVSVEAAAWACDVCGATSDGSIVGSTCPECRSFDYVQMGKQASTPEAGALWMIAHELRQANRSQPDVVTDAPSLAERIGRLERAASDMVEVFTGIRHGYVANSDDDARLNRRKAWAALNRARAALAGEEG